MDIFFWKSLHGNKKGETFIYATHAQIDLRKTDTNYRYVV